MALSAFSSSRTRHGFTIIEAMITTAIAAMVIAAVVQFSFLLQRITFTSQEKVDVANKIRTFTSSLSRDGRSARTIVFYETLPTTFSDLSAHHRLRDGQTGDMVVFVRVRPESITDINQVRAPQRFWLSELVVYARVPDPNDPLGRGPVLRYSIREGVHFTYHADLEEEALELLSVRDDPGNSSIQTLLAEMLIPAQPRIVLTRNPDAEEVIELSRGMANGNLFRNFRDSAVVVNGEIVTGNFQTEGGRVRVSGNQIFNNTYNFTIARQG